jgi:hypothetical protein
MIWFFIEAGVALLLAVFIVWFTMGGKRQRPGEDRENARREPAARGPESEATRGSREASRR